MWNSLQKLYRKVSSHFKERRNGKALIISQMEQSYLQDEMTIILSLLQVNTVVLAHYRNVKQVVNTSVSQPYLISMYYRGIGGDDVCGRMLSLYSLHQGYVQRSGGGISSQILYLSVVAALRFYQYVTLTTRVEHKEFRR